MKKLLILSLCAFSFSLFAEKEEEEKKDNSEQLYEVLVKIVEEKADAVDPIAVTQKYRDLITYMGVTDLFEASYVNANSSNLNNLIGYGQVVLKIYKPGCGHCRAFEPTFNDVSNEYSYKFVNISCDDCDLRSLRIKSFPTIILYSNGREVSRTTGNLTRSEFKSFIKSKF